MIKTKESKVCFRCNTELPIEEFHTIGKLDKNGQPKRIGVCKYCKSEYNKGRYRTRNEYIPKKKNIKSDDKPFNLMQTKYGNPNTFVTKEEREGVFQLLTALGWKFSEEHGRWYKPGLVDKSGEWEFKIKREQEKYNNVFFKLNEKDRIKFNSTNDEKEKIILCIESNLKLKETRVLIPNLTSKVFYSLRKEHTIEIKSNVTPEDAKYVQKLDNVETIEYLLDKGYSVNGIEPHVTCGVGRIYKIITQEGFKKPSKR